MWTSLLVVNVVHIVVVGSLQLHSDQGTNLESTIFQQTLEAFGINKRHTAYHPQCDGMVERVNRSLLQMLRTYVEQDYEWEWYLPLVLYSYHTAVHTSHYLYSCLAQSAGVMIYHHLLHLTQTCAKAIVKQS